MSTIPTILYCGFSLSLIAKILSCSVLSCLDIYYLLGQVRQEWIEGWIEGRGGEGRVTRRCPFLGIRFGLGFGIVCQLTQTRYTALTDRLMEGQYVTMGAIRRVAVPSAVRCGGSEIMGIGTKGGGRRRENFVVGWVAWECMWWMQVSYDVCG